MSEDTSSATSTTEVQETVPQESKAAQNVKLVYTNLEAAQRLSGAFSMVDCKKLNAATDQLIAFFNKPTAISPAITDAFSVLVDGCGIQQKSGKFTMKGSEMLLGMLEEISAEIDKLKEKDTELAKLHELQAKYKTEK